MEHGTSIFPSAKPGSYRRMDSLSIITSRGSWLVQSPVFWPPYVGWPGCLSCEACDRGRFRNLSNRQIDRDFEKPPLMVASNLR